MPLPLLPVLTLTADATATTMLRRGRVQFHLASRRGFCHGVERALKRATETLCVSGGARQVFITSPILHNPQINQDLRRAGVQFLSDADELWQLVRRDDFILLPAFGVSPEMEARVQATGATVVDTTCGSVVFVWKAVERFARDGVTLIYHGRPGHEEATATLARFAAACRKFQQPVRYLVVEDLSQVETLHAVLRRTESPTRLVGSVAACSPGFDPESALEQLGFASQTTMLASETLEIERRLRDAVADRHGAAQLQRRFHASETICGATQERQDALDVLLREDLDLVLVVGGFTSSNSSHLAEMARKRCPTFHVEGPQDIISEHQIRHLPPGSLSARLTSHWLASGPLTIGVTSGASTPEPVLQALIDRVGAVAECSGL